MNAATINVDDQHVFMCSTASRFEDSFGCLLTGSPVIEVGLELDI